MAMRSEPLRDGATPSPTLPLAGGGRGGMTCGVAPLAGVAGEYLGQDEAGGRA